MPTTKYLVAIFLLMLIIVFGLLLLPALVTASQQAQYPLSATDTKAETGATSTTITTNTHGAYGPVWNGSSISGAWTISFNTTSKPAITGDFFTALGSYTANATFTVTGLTAGTAYLITLTFNYAAGAAQQALPALIPLFDVIMILIASVAGVYLIVKEVSSSS